MRMTDIVHSFGYIEMSRKSNDNLNYCMVVK